MKPCIYCGREPTNERLTLEHVIPKFLGGSQAPDEFKIRGACQFCNNNLGLFVDGAFEKNFLVYNELSRLESAFGKPSSKALTCMGISDLKPPEMNSNEVCESWLGPMGEQVYWIRPHDEEKSCYSGGNPRTVKNLESRAYFLFSPKSQKNIYLSLLAFEKAFSGYRVKKIICTQVEGFDMKIIGFSCADNIDKARIEYFINQCTGLKTRHNQILIDLHSNRRFMAKLVLGMTISLFGYDILNTDYYQQLRSALQYKVSEKSAISCLDLSSKLTQESQLQHGLGIPFGVTITVIKSIGELILNLNINTSINLSIVCAKIEELSHEQISKIENGICVILCKPLNLGFKLTHSELILHNMNIIKHPKLSQIEERLKMPVSEIQ